MKGVGTIVAHVNDLMGLLLKSTASASIVAFHEGEEEL
jgi:hypothetical protein